MRGFEFMKVRKKGLLSELLRASLWRWMFIAAACSGAAIPVRAQPYPLKPVRIIVPFAPGGGSDFVARLIGQKLTEALGQQVIIENRPGGGASVGMEYGLRSSPDGYTLTQITPSYTINPSVRPVKFDALTDYTPIVMEGKGPPGGARTSFAACAQRTPLIVY
jgi:tripartite-type tricarboxylate transporter receptor subunit TctC